MPAVNWDNNEFSLNFWFRRKEESFSWSAEQISNVMLSLGNDENCSLQLGTKGTELELYMNTVGKAERTSISASIQNNKWHYVSLSYQASDASGDELKVYMDGTLIGSTSVYAGGLSAGGTEKWLLGIAQLGNQAAGRFIGNLDDIRFFNKATSLSRHQMVYNDGKGDLNLAVHPTYPTATHSNPISIDLNFTRYGLPWQVDLNQSLIGLTNAVIHDLNATTGSNFRLELNATTDPSVVQVNLMAGLGIDSSGNGNTANSFDIGFGRPVTKLENLVAWWTFDAVSYTHLRAHET